MGKTTCTAIYIITVLAMLVKDGSQDKLKRSIPVVSEIYTLDYFIELVEKIEKKVTKIDKVVEHIRSLGYNDAYWQTVIGRAEALPEGILSSSEKDVLTKMVAHKYDGSRELGVVRTASGETIAIGHVINGLDAGISRDYERSLNTWSPRSEKAVDNTFAATLARDLAESTLEKKNTPSKEYFGPAGSWNDDQCPGIYTLSTIQTSASNAELLGSVDGLLLGYQIQRWVRKVRLGQLLRMYYSTGVCFDDSFVSCKRDTKFDKLIGQEDIYIAVSGVADALYLNNPDKYPNVKQEDITKISKAVVEQFSSYFKTIHKNPTCPTNKEGCELPANLVFLMDESGSISSSGFRDEKSFVSQTIDAFSVSPTQTRVAVIKFGTSARLTINLHDYGSKTRLKCAIAGIWKNGGSTNTAGALDMAREDIFLPIVQSHESETKQDDSTNILILLTDGKSNVPTESAIYPAIQRVKDQIKDLTMIAVGVGPVSLFDQELRAIATNPDKHVFTADNFQKLLNYVKVLQNRTCATPVKMNLDFKQEGNITEVKAFVSPGKVRYFVLTAEHFFGADIKIKITPIHGQLRMFASRTTETPGPNDYKYILDPIPAGQSLQLNIGDPCAEYNATTCPPVYFSIHHAESVQCTCTEPDCFLPGQIKFRIEKGKCSKSHASLFLLIVTLALVYAFSN